MKKLKRTYSRCAILAAAVLLLLLIAGSFADLPISKFLYPGHESSFGQFFAAFGELPAFSLLAGCGVLLITQRGRFREELRVILLAGGICLTAASIFLAVHEATDNVPAMPMAVALLVTVFVDALTAFALLVRIPNHSAPALVSSFEYIAVSQQFLLCHTHSHPFGDTIPHYFFNIRRQ